MSPVALSARFILEPVVPGERGKPGETFHAGMPGGAGAQHGGSVRWSNNKENSSSLFVHSSAKHLHSQGLSYVASLPDVSCSCSIRGGWREQREPGRQPERRAWQNLSPEPGTA